MNGSISARGLVADAFGQLVEELRVDGEILAVGAVGREAEMVQAVGVRDRRIRRSTRSPDLVALDRLADLDDLAGPFVAGGHRIGDRDDVAAGEKLVVGMADADVGGADEDFGVASSAGMGTSTTTGFSGRFKDEGFHGVFSPSGRSRPRRIRAERTIASSSAMLLIISLAGDRVRAPRRGRRARRR